MRHRQLYEGKPRFNVGDRVLVINRSINLIEKELDGKLPVGCWTDERVLSWTGVIKAIKKQGCFGSPYTRGYYELDWDKNQSFKPPIAVVQGGIFSDFIYQIR